ncbi:MAG: 4Fe-4S dicluster domain-containing protein [Planctomycetaceae bacterium]|nr:4Fe-4S dicluster domain-containing protein [Planctomycetaceae bacterium]
MRFGTFTGGIDLPHEKYATEDSPIAPWPHLERLQVPLAPCGRGAAECIIESGQRVAAGQRIARALDNTSLDIFSPAAALVTGITTVDVCMGDRFVPSPAIELVDLAEPPMNADSPANNSWRTSSPEALRRRLAEGGLTTCRNPLEPLHLFIDRAKMYRCRTVVANLMENQPYLTGDHRLMVERGHEVLAGLAIIARAIEAGQTILAADRRYIDDYGELARAEAALGVTCIALPHKYPIGADAILVKVLTRREAPHGSSLMATGAAVVGAWACVAAYRWVACGACPTHRVVTVSGELSATHGNFLLPVGTRCGDLGNFVRHAPLHGGPMNGCLCPARAVVTWATEAVLAIHPAEAQPASPCIRCGWCTDHCPARLNVSALNDAYELGLLDQARRAHVTACVECGVCSFICPARLPLTERVRQLKRAIHPGPAVAAVVGD